MHTHLSGLLLQLLNDKALLLPILQLQEVLGIRGGNLTEVV
jgi:hypothetical protein